MRFVARNIAGQIIIDKTLYKCTLNKSTRGQDEISCSMHMEKSPEEIVKIQAYVAGKLVFSGESISQDYYQSDNGWMLDIRGISIRSIMMRNRAVPGSMGKITFQNLLYTIGGPYQVTQYLGTATAPTVNFFIDNSMSDWDVIERYCLINYGVFPRLLPNNVVDISNISPSSSLMFSNDQTLPISNIIPYCDLRPYFRRDKMINHYVSLSATDETYYSVDVFDDVALERKIMHRKIRDLKTYTDSQKKSILSGEMRAARYQSAGYILTINGLYDVNVSMYASIKDKVFGDIYYLIATQCKYIYNNGFLRTEVELQPDENVL